MAPEHPEWQTADPFKSVLAGDRAAMAKLNEQEWAQIVMATHAGMTTEAFLAIVKQWLATAKHPRFRKSYTELVYQPMLDVMNYLRTNGFKTYIVTGGGQEFVRAYSSDVYEIPQEREGRVAATLVSDSIGVLAVTSRASGCADRITGGLPAEQMK